MVEGGGLGCVKDEYEHFMCICTAAGDVCITQWDNQTVDVSELCLYL